MAAIGPSGVSVAGKAGLEADKPACQTVMRLDSEARELVWASNWASSF